MAVTNAPVAIYYNPVSYLSPTDFSTKFTLTAGATLTQYMLVFPDGANKAFDGTTAANFSSLKGAPAGVTLIADPGATASFATADVGSGKTVTFSGYSLGGPNAGNYAFAVSCCAPIGQKTTANITAPISSALQVLSSGASVVLPFLLPEVFTPVVAAPLITASLESPPSMVFAETLTETQVVLPAEVPAPPPPYIAPVRPRKQGRQ